MDKELVAVSLDNLGQVYLMMNRFPEAEQHFLRGLQLFREALGETAPDTLMCLENFATVYNRTGRRAKAIDSLTVGLDSTIRDRAENAKCAALLRHWAICIWPSAVFRWP
jgi:tetratricopeptide (TPR) repeat protein